MKKRILFFAALMMLTASAAHAALTAGTVPVTKTGGSTPSLENSVITQSGTSVTVGGSIAASNLSGTNTGDQTNITGNAATATALAADPSACSAGQYASDIAANGTLTCGTPTDTNTNASTLCSGTTTYLDGEGNCDDISSVYQGADTDLSSIAGGVTGIVKGAGNGSGYSAASAGTDYVVPAGNVATATALAANGANCSAGYYPLGVDASGAAESCTAAAVDTNTNASTICSGTTTYLDGEGNCDDISSVYESHTSNDIDPDRLNGDTTDNNLIDAGIVNGVKDADYGDITVSSGAWSFDNDTVQSADINWTSIEQVKELSSLAINWQDLEEIQEEAINWTSIPNAADGKALIWRAGGNVNWETATGSGTLDASGTPTANYIATWADADTLQEGAVKLGTMTDTKYCIYDSASDSIVCNTTPAGGGDVTGPASSTDEAIARYDGTGGKTLQNSATTLSDTGQISIPTEVSVKIGDNSFITDLNGETWITSNAYWNGTNFIKVTSDQNAIMMQLMGGDQGWPIGGDPVDGTRAGEGSQSDGFAMWRVVDTTSTIANTFAGVNGPQLMFGSIYGNFVIEGQGFELDGNATLPYGRIVHTPASTAPAGTAPTGSMNCATDSSAIDRLHDGVVSNIYADFSCMDNSGKESWFAGITSSAACSAGVCTPDHFAVKRLPASTAISRTNMPEIFSVYANGVLGMYASTSQTTDAAGEIAFDSNAWATDRGTVQMYDGTANTYVLAALASDTPSNGQVPKWNTGGTITWEDDTQSAGSATAWDDIADPDADATIAFAGYEQDITSTLDEAAHSVLTITNTDADRAAATTILTLADYDGGDAEATYLSMIGDADGTPTTDFTFNQSTGFTSLLPIVPPAEAYDATGWNGDTGAPQKDAVRDKIETLAPLASPTFTGSVDAGGADDLEIPNGTGPTVDTAGQIAVDTTSDQLVYYGGAKRVLTYRETSCRTLETPTDDDDDIPVWMFPEARTITDVHCQTEGGTSIAVTISDGTNALEAITCDADGADDDGSITNGTFTANEEIQWDFGAPSGAVDWVTVCITTTITAD